MTITLELPNSTLELPTKPHLINKHHEHQSNEIYIPNLAHRPGDALDFSHLNIPKAGATDKPPVDVNAQSITDMAYGLIRVLGDNDEAVGDWNPNLHPDTLRKGLRNMMLTRAYDERMFRMQRQGKLSFYIKSTGEEGLSIAQAMALEFNDMLFPTYRQQGLLFARNHNIVEMMCHCISNSGDTAKGRQMPTFYTWRDGNFFSISGNLATQYNQAVGWAMASAYKGENNIAAAYVGDGASAEADVYNALLFASTYRAPVILNIVNNQWAISTPQSFASGGTTFAARGIGFNIPSLRVDANDFLATYAVTQWAAQRARMGLGATLIELFTYRVDSHSTSDDPSRYRCGEEAKKWPLGDPLIRLKQHLINLNEWSEEQHQELTEELTQFVTQSWKEAEKLGTLQGAPHWPIQEMFTDVYKDLPVHLKRQLNEASQ